MSILQTTDCRSWDWILAYKFNVTTLLWALVWETGASCYRGRLLQRRFYAKLSHWWRHRRQQLYPNPSREPLTKENHRCTQIIRDMDKNHFVYPWNLFTYLHNFSSSEVNYEEWLVKNWNVRAVYNASQHYINDASIFFMCASLPHARAFIRKTWPWGKMLQKSWGTLIQYGKRNKSIPE